MNFKVWSILAVVALVFVFTATANPEEERDNKMGHPKEADHVVKNTEERDGWMWELQKKFNKIPENVRAELEKEVRLKWENKVKTDKQQAEKAHTEDKHAPVVPAV